MPNQQEQSAAHSADYYLSFPDGTLSKELLDFSYQGEKWTDELLTMQIGQKIYALPEGSSPHYYQGKQTPSDFNTYAATEEGKEKIRIIREELDRCFEKLINWANVQNLQVTNQRMTQSVSVGGGLKTFYTRLINGEFSDKTVLFYADGKKSIETLTLLIQDESIDVAFRQNQLISISAEGSLQLCAEGCFSRFTSAAESLKNFGDFSIPILVKKFVRALAEEVVKRPVPLNPSYCYSEYLCVLSGWGVGNEIHAQNALINQLLKELNLQALAINDSYTRVFEKQSVEYLKSMFVQEFKIKFTASRFIEFIKQQYYQAENIQFIEKVLRQEEIAVLEDFLKNLGVDKDFNLDEILAFDEHTGNSGLKDKDVLAITLLERLYNQGLLAGDNSRWIEKFDYLIPIFKEYDVISSSPLIQKTFSQDYRVVPGNIELAWLKDQEGERVLLLHCLESIKNCLAMLKQRLPSEQLNSLFIDINDLTKFFDKLPSAQHAEALSWMQENNLQLDRIMFHNYLFYKQRIFFGYGVESCLKHYNELLTVIDPQVLPEFVKHTSQYVDRLLEGAINAVINSAKIHKGRSSIVPVVLKIIRRIQQGGFKTFMDLDFGENFIKYKDYQDGIDFSNTYFLNTKFYEIYKSNFEGAILKNLIIEKNVVNVNFRKTKGDIKKGDIKIHGNVMETDFSDAFLDIQIKGSVTDSYFTNFAGELKIGGVADSVNLNCAKGASIELNTGIKHCNLHAIRFKQITINGEISDSYFTAIDFRKTHFFEKTPTATNQGKSIFCGQFLFDMEKMDGSQAFFSDSRFSTASLTEFLRHPAMQAFVKSEQAFVKSEQAFPLLMATDLREVDFQDRMLQRGLKKFSTLYFDEANLQSVDFSGFNFKEVSFKKANLRGSSFCGAKLSKCKLQGADLSDCDFSTANIELSDVSGAKIDNLKLNCEQLFHFYEQGHRDFSTLRLVGKLKNTETRSLAGAKLSSEVFEYLIEQGFKNFNEVDLMAVSAEILSKYDGRDDLSFKKTAMSSRRASTVMGCLQGGSRKKREINCLFDEDDVKEFSSEGEHGERQIDSKRFLEVFPSAGEEKQAQLIDFASLWPIVGTKQAEVQKITEVRQWQLHLNKAGQVAGLMSKGLMFKNTLASFLNGDYTDTAINLGFLGGGPFLAHFSKELESMGEAFLFEGKNLLGNGFKAASPFFKRGSSAFMVYDLIQAVKGLNSSDSATVVRVVGDSIYIGVDVAEVGIEIAEVFEIFEGVSAITGPIGEAIGAVIFLGTDIYQAVARVKQIDEMLHLTGGEKFREGVRAFLGMSPEGYLEDLLQEKQFNEAVIKQKWEFLKQHPTIKNYLFPVETQVCHKERYLEGAKWQGGKGRWRLIEVCDQTKPVLDNRISLYGPKEQRAFGREKPGVPESGDLLCFPEGNGGTTGLSYPCENAIGIGDPSPKAGNDTLINVGAGKDLAFGFLDSPNIIVASNGDKNLVGGNQNDSFILQGNVISGIIDGKGGVNTLDLANFGLDKQEPLQVVFGRYNDSYIVNNNSKSGSSLKIFNIQNLRTRSERVDFIHTDRCDTYSIDSGGGYSHHSYGQDRIAIGNNPDCYYQMQLKVAPHTVIINQASQGNFSYLMTRDSDESEISFEPLGKDTAQHQISFNYTLEEIKQVRLSDNKVIFNLISKAGNEFNVTLNRLNSTKISSVFMDAEVKLGDKRTYTLQQTEKAPAEIVRQYPALAEKLQGSLVIQARNQTVVIGYPFHHDVLQNDPLQPSHLVGNGGENIYRIEPGANNQKIPKVTVYPPPANSTQVETLDVRPVINKLEANPNCTALLKIRKKANNLHLIVMPKKNKRCKFRKNIATIMLKDAAKANRTSRFNIIAHQSFLEINNAWSLVPKPLEFDETKKIIVLSADDIEAHTRVMLPKIPGGFAFARTGEDLQDLVITSNRIKQARTVLIKDFYSAQGWDAYKLQTLLLRFGNKTVHLRKVVNRSLPSLTALQNNKKEQIYHSIFGKTISDVTTIQSAASNGILVGLVLVPVAVVGYFVRRHVLGRQPRLAVENAAAAAALLAVATLPEQIDAKPIISNTEMLACHTPPFKNDECTQSQFQSGELGYCANEETKLAWFKEEAGSLSYVISDHVDSHDSSERLFFRGNDLYFLHSDQCQQRIPLEAIHLPTQTQDSFVQQLLTLVAQQRRIKQQQYEVAVEQFKQGANVIACSYLGEQGLVHSHLGDYFRVVGLRPNWQQRDASHWTNRMLRSWFSHNVLSIGSISGVCLETALLHPFVQSTFPGDTYRGKSVIRFIADLFQFGVSVSTCIPALIEFLCYQHPWSYELAMGLRGSLAMLEVLNDPSSWYLAMGLFILPQLPYLLENMGIPVTRCISHTLEMLERFLLPYSLLLSVQEDSERLKIKAIDLVAADQRVSKGQERMLAVYHSGVGFFSKSKISEAETNDAEFCKPTQRVTKS